MINNKVLWATWCITFAWGAHNRPIAPWTLIISASLGLINRIVLAMASSGVMVATYSGIAQQRSVRLIESEDGDFLALSLNPLANILSHYMI